jgi:Saxitoxin biosynthesis operon protein SxtJ
MVEQSRASLRKFGLVVGAVLAALAGWFYWRGHNLLPFILGAVGGLLITGGAVAPTLLAPVERAWMALAHVLGRINTTLILTALYFLVFMPVGYIRRSISDPLDRRMGQPKDSHWIARTPSTNDPDRYRHQF